MAQAAAEAEQAAAAPAAGVNATPLGLFGFALSLFVLSCSLAGFFTTGKTPAEGGAIIVALAVFYGGIVLLLAGMWEFRAANNFTGTVFTSYGAFWLSYAFLSNAGNTNLAALGFFLVAWGIFSILVLICVLRTNTALIATIAFLILTILALIIGAFGGGATWFSIGGYLGIIDSLIAWYLALAGILPYVNPGIKLPVG